MGVQIQGDTGNVIATKGTYSGNVTIGGTLTYEDVTNIDSVGLITARNGIEVGARPGVAASISVDGNAIFSGITTIGSKEVGVGITLSPDGHVSVSGVVTATSFSGDGSALTGIAATDNVRTGILDVAGVGTFRDNVNITSTLPKIIMTDSDGGDVFQLRNDSGSFVIRNATDSRSDLTVSGGGDVTIANGDLVIGTGGKGIDFSAQTTSTASGVTAATSSGDERLEHYEQGTWSASVRAEQNGTASTSTTNDSRYVRIGNFVHCVAYFTINSYAAGTTNGSLYLTGLPFTNTGNHGAAHFHFFAGFGQNINFITGTVQANTAEVLVRGSTSESGSTDTIDFDATVNANDAIIFSCNYVTS